MVDMAALPNPYACPVISLEAAAACLGMSRTTAWRAVQADRFPVPLFPLGGFPRVSVFHLYAYLGQPLPPEPPRPPRVITLNPPG